ncbi:hypothetical protein PMAYCL1PPCAC_25848, partial [Pristionchus mayeri]
DFGMGKNVMEAQVKSSMEECMKNLESIEDKSAVDFRWPLQILVANVINEVLFGYHYKYNDCKRLMDFSNNLAAHMENMRKNPLVFLIMQFPFLARFPSIGWRGHGQYKRNCKYFHDHIREDIRRCLMTYDENVEPACFVHAYKQ